MPKIHATLRALKEALCVLIMATATIHAPVHLDTRAKTGRACRLIIVRMKDFVAPETAQTFRVAIVVRVQQGITMETEHV